MPNDSDSAQGDRSQCQRSAFGGCGWSAPKAIGELPGLPASPMSARGVGCPRPARRADPDRHRTSLPEVVGVGQRVAESGAADHGGGGLGGSSRCRRPSRRAGRSPTPPGGRHPTRAEPWRQSSTPAKFWWPVTQRRRSPGARWPDAPNDVGQHPARLRSDRGPRWRGGRAQGRGSWITPRVSHRRHPGRAIPVEPDGRQAARVGAPLQEVGRLSSDRLDGHGGRSVPGTPPALAAIAAPARHMGRPPPGVPRETGEVPRETSERSFGPTHGSLRSSLRRPRRRGSDPDR
ncbi:hypothetical protein FHX75_121172 [Micromonospora palomenae]|uniref:Uncharacterized protein n=1 Tax=Micromonospora palomenae TaxID=1461247 RepID=A0A561WFK3_9ACTN|nr:hypothetical protein FHX75_121172 [Micromonospora palomenae]